MMLFSQDGYKTTFTGLDEYAPYKVKAELIDDCTEEVETCTVFVIARDEYRARVKAYNYLTELFENMRTVGRVTVIEQMYNHAVII